DAPALQPVGVGMGEARYPGELQSLEFRPLWWGVVPGSGELVVADIEGVHQSGDEWSRLPVQVPPDLLNLEVGPDGTTALLSGPGRDTLAVRAQLFDTEGFDRGTIDIGSQVAGAAAILDTANLGQEGGFLVLTLLSSPYPALLTQYLNDQARVMLRDRNQTPFLIRFEWRGGTLAALTPLPDLPEPLELARVSGDPLTTVLLARGTSEHFLRVLSSGNLGEVGDLPLTLGQPALELASSLAALADGRIMALDQVHDPGGLVPLLALKHTGGEWEGRADLLPLPPGSRFDAGGLGLDGQGRAWWGGQVVDEGGVRGSVWQRWTLEPALKETDLFRSLPTDLFNMGTLNPVDRLPYLLAQGTAPDGSMLALAGTFQPVASSLLFFPPGAPAPEQWELPPDFDPFAHGQLTILADGADGWILAGRSEIGGSAVAFLRRAEDREWRGIERLPQMGIWPLTHHGEGLQVWLAPGFGLLEVDTDGEVRRIAGNPAPQVAAIRMAVSTPEQDLLLHRDLGQVWAVDRGAYKPLPVPTHGDVNEALLVLSDAVAAYFRRTSLFPPAIARTWLQGDVEGSYTWDRLWDHFIGGRPVHYERTLDAYDLVVWSAEPGQPLYWLSELGMQELDPAVGFVPASRRSIRPMP
ncbi:MAG TPA: hypothetical protein VEI97_01605, partial [bacterium]|nr:hypothetical protein [bacterium]